MADPAVTPRSARCLLRPRWLLRHVLVIVLVVVFGALANWQYSRAVAGNALSWAYTLQWPMFAGFVVAMWIRAVRDELRVARREPPAVPPPIRRPPPPIRRPPRVDAGRPPRPELDASATPARAAQVTDSRETQDAELVAYNRYLAWLNANPDRRPSEYPG